MKKRLKPLVVKQTKYVMMGICNKSTKFKEDDECVWHSMSTCQMNEFGEECSFKEQNWSPNLNSKWVFLRYLQ